MIADVTRQAENVARKRARRGGSRRQSGKIKSQPAGEQFKPAFTLPATAADPRQRGEPRAGKQRLDSRNRRARSRREKQRQTAFRTSAVKMARTCDQPPPLPTSLS